VSLRLYGRNHFPHRGKIELARVLVLVIDVPDGEADAAGVEIAYGAGRITRGVVAKHEVQSGHLVTRGLNGCRYRSDADRVRDEVVPALVLAY